MKQVVVLADAAEDIEAARDFYEAQVTGVGGYYVDSTDVMAGATSIADFGSRKADRVAFMHRKRLTMVDRALRARCQE